VRAAPLKVPRDIQFELLHKSKKNNKNNDENETIKVQVHKTLKSSWLQNYQGNSWHQSDISARCNERTRTVKQIKNKQKTERVNEFIYNNLIVNKFI
jgi:hypothetical protein